MGFGASPQHLLSQKLPWTPTIPPNLKRKSFSNPFFLDVYAKVLLNFPQCK